MSLSLWALAEKLQAGHLSSRSRKPPSAHRHGGNRAGRRAPDCPCSMQGHMDFSLGAASVPMPQASHAWPSAPAAACDLAVSTCPKDLISFLYVVGGPGSVVPLEGGNSPGGWAAGGPGEMSLQPSSYCWVWGRGRREDWEGGWERSSVPLRSQEGAPLLGQCGT